LTRVERMLFVGVPAACLILSFVVISVHFRTAWPWSAMVHETGTRNLVQTIFYFEHALGELPLELLIAGAAAGSVLMFFAPQPAGGLRHQTAGWLAIALATDLIMLVGSALTAGPSLSREYLLQYVTRPDGPVEFGSHWRYHLLSQISLMALPIVLLGARAMLQRRPLAKPRTQGARMLGASWLLFAALSIVFGLNASPFTDPQYLGHQARELFTHSLVTVPLSLAVCLTLSERSKPGCRWARFAWRAVIGAAVVYVVPSLYLLLGVVNKSSYSHAQTSDPVSIVCGHFFEHFFSYLVVPSHAAVFYLFSARNAQRVEA